MEKLKFLAAIGLCAVILLVPLMSAAENPLPIGSTSDGHPWDDGTGNDETVPGDQPGDTTILEDLTWDDDDLAFNEPKKSFTTFLIIWKLLEVLKLAK